MVETSGSRTVSTKLGRIAELAREAPGMVFTTLAHNIDIEWLKEAYRRTRKDGARGVDGQSAEEYAANLEENLLSLLERAKSGTYRAPAVRRVHIPKAKGGETRPIGIPTFEDKVLQRAVVMVLEAVYEQDFFDCSYGFRPRRSAHQALETLRTAVMEMKGGTVLEIDVRKYFDTVDHGHLTELVRQRVRDGVLLRLIGKCLRVGVLDGESYETPDEGTAQGSRLSPMLGNIYLHYVLDLWFSRRVSRQSRGEAYYFRFADDFVACFQYKDDAGNFQRHLEDRLERFGLQLSKEKTHCIEFGRYARENAYKRGEKPKEFTFLGFTHYCGKTKEGYFKVKRRTSRKKLGQSLSKFTDWARHARNVLKKGDMLRQARIRVFGHLNYYAITDNLERCRYYVRRTEQILFKWLNRKSQRRAYTWESFAQALKWVGWPKLRIHKNLNPCRRAEVC